MTVRARLTLAVLAVTLIMAGPALFALAQLQDARDLAVELRERHASAGSAVGELRSALGDVDLAARGYAATGSNLARGRLAAAVSGTAVAAARLRMAGYGDAARPSLELVRAVQAGVYQVVRPGARGDLAGATLAFRGLETLLARTEARLLELDVVIRDRSARAARRAGELATSAAATTTFSLIAAILLSFLVGGVVARTVIGPLGELRGAMGRVAEGEFRPPEELDYERRDELGSLNRAFRWMTERLAELDRMKAEFVSAASHKLKTPVSVAMGYADMLLAGEFGDVDQEQRQVLEEVYEQMDDLTGQIEGLMRLSRAEAGTLRLDFAETHVEDMADALRRAFDAAARQKRAEFRVEVEPDAPETVRADEERLRDLVLGNLLDNAFKYGDRGNSVELRLRGEEARQEPGDGTAGSWLAMEVRDTGPGIPPQELDGIFQPYVRAGNVGDRPGTGVGLAIARQVVEAHGGDIRVDSRPGVGTTFVVRIPVTGDAG